MVIWICFLWVCSILPWALMGNYLQLLETTQKHFWWILKQERLASSACLCYICKCEKFWISNFVCLCRLSHLCMDTWISHLHPHGILTGKYLLLGTKTKHAVFGMFGTCQNLLLFLKATSELFVPYVSLLMVSSWRWQSRRTSFMFTTQSMGLKRSRRLIFLGRSLVYPLALTQNHFLLVFGTAPMEAFYSWTDAETTCIWTACKCVTLLLVSTCSLCCVVLVFRNLSLVVPS